MASPAPGKRMSTNGITYTPAELLPVLYVEDQDDYLELIGGFLSGLGCYVEKVKYPKQALQSLHHRKYRMVIFDHEFGNSDMKGLDFLIRYKYLLGRAKPILLTQFAGAVRELKGNQDWITVIDKPYYKQELGAQVDVVYEEVRENIEKALIDDPVSKYPLAEAELETLENELIEGLKRSDNLDRKSLPLGKKLYSIQDLIDEVTAQTKLGRRLVATLYNANKITKKVDEKYASHVREMDLE
jgi:CheY-like chemotaxis protein